MAINTNNLYRPNKAWGLMAWLVLFVSTLLFLHGVRFLADAAKVLAREVSTLPSPTLNHYPSLTSQIYDREGNLIYEIYADENRKIVKFDQIPLWVKQAFIATEDQTFYEHHGFSTRAILRAVWVNWENRVLLEGGSTIPQQLVRSLWLSPTKTWERKIKETILSVLIDARYSKDEILENFLNNTPMDFNLVGVETAAQVYFNKNTKDLTLPQSVLLAALSNSPTLLNPYTNRYGLNQRASIVLQQMTEAGFISNQQMLQAKEAVEKAGFQPYTPLLKYPYFSMHVREILEEELGADLVQSGGLRVYTTLDPKLQTLAEDLMQKHAFLNAQRYHASDAALLAVDPKTGQVLAWVGGVDFDRSQVDLLTSPRQPGSAIKPLIYLTAFEKGFTPESVVLDEYENFGQGYVPTNYGGQVSGQWQTMRVALAASLNIPAVRTLRKVGVGDGVKRLIDLGLPLNPEKYYGLSLGLGAVEVSPFDLAQAFQVLANDGQRVPLTIQLNNDPRPAARAGEKIAEKEVVAMVNSILSDYQTKHAIYGYGTQFKNYTLPDRPVAAKTGTSSGPKDTWMVGYTPQLLTVVWAGNVDGTNMASFADGINVAAPLWHEFMEKALEREPIENFAAYTAVKPQKGFEYIK